MPKPNRKKFGTGFLKLDSYAEPVRLNYDGGQTLFKTRTGSCITLIEIGVVLLFTVQHLNTMAARTNYTVSTNFESPDYTTPYGQAQNFTFAFGISSFSGGAVVDLDDYVTLRPQYAIWNQSVSDSF
jgi:hypothetical protein